MKRYHMLAAGAGLFLLLHLTGCSHIVETCKVLWGSSTRALEESRSQALTKDFFCEFSTCFDAVVSLTEMQETPAGLESRIFRPFIVRRAKKMIVLLGGPGIVDTTEVGVFFDERPNGIIRVEIASLSTSAKTKAAEIILERLAQDCLDIKKR